MHAATFPRLYSTLRSYSARNDSNQALFSDNVTIQAERWLPCCHTSYQTKTHSALTNGAVCVL